MKWAAIAAGALAIAAPAFAGTVVKVPAPAVGKVRVEKLLIKGSGMLTLSASNLSALGPGFGGVAVVGKPVSGVRTVDLVMFMGNRSTSPANTVDLDVGGGAPAGKPTDESTNCKELQRIYDASATYSGLAQAALILVDHSGSTAKSELKGDLTYQKEGVGCK